MTIVPAGSQTYRPPSASSGSGIPATGITRDQIADPGGLGSVRRAARFDGGSSLAITHVSVAATEHSYALTVVHEGAAGILIGDAAANQSNLYATAAGDLVLREGTNTLATVPGALIEGVPVRASVTFAGDGASATAQIDGGAAQSFSFGPITWGTRTSRVVGSRTGAQEAYTGAIYDVELRAGADTNTAFYALDGSFTNTHPGSTVADATATGFIPFAKVLSNAGGAPVLAKDKYEILLTRASADTVNGTTKRVNWTSVVLDQTGVATTGDTPFTLPADGTVIVTAAIAFDANADPQDELSITFVVGSTFFGYSDFEGGTRMEAGIETAFGAASGSAGDAVRIEIGGVAATTTLGFANSWARIEFIPD